VKSTIVESLRTRILLADGGIGTELQRLGLEPGVCGDSWNLDSPEKVRLVHRSYVEAGAEMITTNSFRGNRLALADFDLGSSVREINLTAATLARDAAGDAAWVMGSVGPLGVFLEPLGDISVEVASDVFREQIEALLEGGVDAIIIETMTALEELDIAIRAARNAGSPLIIATMAFDRVRDGYKTMMGVSPEQMDQVVKEADVIGCNCGNQLEMEGYAKIVGQIRTFSNKPIIAQPNAGQPELIAGQIVYRQAPKDMASGVNKLIDAGAGIVGGCCGTTPEHIRLFAEEIRVRIRNG
jgi:5-methyltetrahydrofolate--homocysteine methyltransferase